MKFMNFLILITTLLVACSKQQGDLSSLKSSEIMSQLQNYSSGNIHKGKIVGCLKCSDNEMKNTLIGIFIISNNKDSLLSFNVPSSIYNLDTSKIDYGINFLNGDSVSFSYGDAKNGEIKRFSYPPATMQNLTFYPIENFSQVVIINISKIH